MPTFTRGPPATCRGIWAAEEKRRESSARFGGCADIVRGRLAHPGLIQHHPEQAALNARRVCQGDGLARYLGGVPFILLFNTLSLPGALVVAVLEPFCGCGVAVAAPVLVALAVLCGFTSGGLWLYRRS